MLIIWTSPCHQYLDLCRNTMFCLRGMLSKGAFTSNQRSIEQRSIWKVYIKTKARATLAENHIGIFTPEPSWFCTSVVLIARMVMFELYSFFLVASVPWLIPSIVPSESFVATCCVEFLRGVAFKWPELVFSKERCPIIWLVHFTFSIYTHEHVIWPELAKLRGQTMS